MNRIPRSALWVAGCAFVAVALAAAVVAFTMLPTWNKEVTLLRSANESRDLGLEFTQKEVDALVVETATMTAEATEFAAAVERDRAAAARIAEEKKTAPPPRYTLAEAAIRSDRATQAFTSVLNSVAGVGKKSSPAVVKLVDAASAESDRLAEKDAVNLAKIDDALAQAAKRHGRNELETHHLSRLAAAEAAPKPKANEASPNASADTSGPKSSKPASPTETSKQIGRLKQLAASLARSGKLDEASAKALEAIEMARALPEKERGSQLFSALDVHGIRLLKAGRDAEAEPLLREAYELKCSTAKRETDAGTCGRRLALTLVHLGRASEAESIINKVLEAYDKAGTDLSQGDVLGARSVKLMVLHALGRKREEDRLALEVNEVISFVFNVYGGTFDAEWIEYLTTVSAFETAEHGLWSAATAHLDSKTRGSVEEAVRDLVEMLERNGKQDRAAMYKRWLVRQSTVAAPDAANDSPAEEKQ